MIKLFRKIRPELVTNGKISNYLLYAMGEIILVVAGILIALAVNNWSQHQKERKAGEDLLVRIHRDLVQDTLNFQSIIVQNNLLREEIKAVLSDLYDGVETIEEVQYMSAVYDKALDQVFSPNDNTYQSMISSGTLGLIHNEEVKEAVIDLYAEYELKRALLSSMNSWMIGIVSTMDTETDFIKFNQGVSDIYTTEEMFGKNDLIFLNDKNDPRFQLLVRAISATAFNQSAGNAIYAALIERCRIVIEQIENDTYL